MGNSACCKATEEEGEFVLRASSQPSEPKDDAKLKSRLVADKDGTGGTAHGQGNGALDQAKATGDETQGQSMKPMPNPHRKALQEQVAGNEELKEPEDPEQKAQENMDFDKIQSLDEQKAGGHMSDILSSNHFSVQKRDLEDADNSQLVPQVDITQDENLIRNFKSAEKAENKSMSDIQVPEVLGGSDQKPNKSQDILLGSPEQETPQGQTPGQSSVKQPQDAPNQLAKHVVGEVKTFQKEVEAE